MVFEAKHSFNKQEFEIFTGRNLSFISHIHLAFELYLQTEGKARVTIDKRTYTLSAGQAVLVFPFQFHSYEALEDGAYSICIFSPELVPDYYKNGSLVPTDNLFSFSRGALAADTPLLCRALAYEICGEFDKNREYTAKKNLLSQDKIISILLYVNENYNKKCLLCDAAAAVGFDYAYISKLFKKTIGIPFNQYVNYLRIQQSQKLLKATDKTVTEIAFECGFSSLRAFGRRFFEITGTTPSAYRKGHTHFLP